MKKELINDFISSILTEDDGERNKMADELLVGMPDDYISICKAWFNTGWIRATLAITQRLSELNSAEQ